MIEIIPNFHPVFVHFTIALFSISTLLYLLAHITSNEELQSQWLAVARWNLWIGITITVVTVAAGWQAYYSVDHDTPSHIVMTEHRNLAMVTFVLFSVLAVWSVVIHRSANFKNWLFVGLMIISSGVLLSTAWHGGEIVFRYGLGVMSLPKSEGKGHDHKHADAEGHGASKAMAADMNKEMQNDNHDNSDGHHDKKEEKAAAEHDDDGHSH